MHSPARHNPLSSVGMPPHGGPLFTERRNSVLTLARFRSHAGAQYLLGLPTQDAFVLTYQLTELPAHEFWNGDRRGRNDPARCFAANLFDLNADPGCRIPGPFENVLLHIPRAALDDVADEADAPKIAELHAPEGWNTRDPVLCHLMAGIVPAMERPQDVSALFLDHLVLAVLVHLARSYGGMRDAERVRNGGLAPWQERRAKELLAANLVKELPLQRIAHECGLSTSYFSRAFKMSTGATPHEWLQSRRVERSKMLLMQTNRPLAEIALACGFADQSHFTRVFARIAGDTPGAWRRFRRV